MDIKVKNVMWNSEASSEFIPRRIDAKDLIFQFLLEKFPYHGIDYIYYNPQGPQPGDYKAPEFHVAGHLIGWLIDNKQFVPRGSPGVRVREDCMAISMADPMFFDLLHAVVVYEVGYDPLRPGSREAFMAATDEDGIREYIKFHPELNMVYYPPV